MPKHICGHEAYGVRVKTLHQAKDVSTLNADSQGSMTFSLRTRVPPLVIQRPVLSGAALLFWRPDVLLDYQTSVHAAARARW